MAFTYSFTGLDTPFVAGSEKAFTVTAQSDVPVADFGRFKFTFSGAGLVLGDVTVTYDDGTGTYLNLPLVMDGPNIVGYFGPLAGFQYDTLPHTSNFKSLWTAGNAGTYSMLAEFARVSDGANIGGTQSVAVTVADLKANSVIEVDPISRIEGHLGVKLTTGADGLVTEADVHGNLWRGFENFLIGRNPNDAITFVQRICGVCPVPHGTTAMFAVESVYGYNSNFQTFSTATDANGVPPKALHIRNLVLAAEYLMSSITHFYHLAAPSYVQGPNMAPWTPYFDTSYYHPLLLSAGHGTDGASGTGVLPLKDATNGFSADLWSAVINQYIKALRIRRLTFEAGALFAGRMPMTSTFVAGGVTTDHTEDLTVKCTKFRAMIAEVGAFVVKEYVPLVLALGALYTPFDNVNNGGSGYGAGIKKFLSWGAFPQTDGSLALFRGYKPGMTPAAAPQSINTADVHANLREDCTFARYDTVSAKAKAAGYTTDGDPASAVSPVSDPSKVNRTIPLRGDASKYSWLKAPRWNGNSAEGGPMARMFVMGLFKDNVALATSVDLTPFGLADYMDYVHVSGDGLDPKMVGADLAVALLREGLAELHAPNVLGGVVVGKTVGTAGVTHSIIGLANATILAAYTEAGSYITGTVAGWIIGLKGGASTMDRVRGRAIESLYLVQKMLGGFNKTTGVFGGGTGGWIGDLATETDTATYAPGTGVPLGTVSGFGACDAPRGALMHFITIKGGKIDAYQCVVPTTWNASPKSDVGPGGVMGTGERGPMEQAMIGIPYSDAGASFKNTAGVTVPTAGGVEALRVAQSFDPCIACAVH